jgi:hypothetical protein
VAAARALMSAHRGKLEFAPDGLCSTIEAAVTTRFMEQPA